MESYPGVKTINQNLEIIKKAGYRIISHFVLPNESWWTHHHMPIEAKIPSMKLKYKDDREPLAHLATEELEIVMFRRYSYYYRYMFYIMQLEA